MRRAKLYRHRKAADKVGREFMDIIESFGVGKPFLVQGTCLGFYRFNNYIRWDEDFDIGFVCESDDTYNMIKDKILENGFILENPKKDYHFIKDHIMCDLRRYKLRPDGKFYVDRSGWSIRKDLLDNLYEYEYKNGILYMPSPPEEYLDLHYSPTWRDEWDHNPGQVWKDNLIGGDPDNPKGFSHTSD
jgi:hypothetical protein